MAEYFRYDFEIQLAFEQHLDLLGTRFSFMPIASDAVYTASLTYNQIKPEYVKFTIYYDQSDYIFERLEFLKVHGINILDLIHPAPKASEWSYPDILDFKESSLISLEESHYWQHGKKPVVITITSVSIAQEGGFPYHGRFRLTANAIQHIDKHITYNHTYNIEEDRRFVYENTNKTLRFGPVEFTLAFEHQYQSIIGREITITRDPYLILTDHAETLTADQFTEQGNNVCLLLSFYWQKAIDYFHARVKLTSPEHYRTKEIIHYSDHQADTTISSILDKKFGSFYEFIARVDYDQFRIHSALLADMTIRIIRSKNIDSTSRFMVYYNIIEKIRNYCMDNPIKGNSLSIKEEYDFIGSKGSIKKIIKEAIQSISPIVQEHDKEEFLANASNKITFLKKTGLLDQFESLIAYLALNPSDYTIDFKILIAIRNNIYHGKLPEENTDEYTHQMSILIYDMLTKLITY